MDPESLLPRLQVPTTCPYPEPDQPSPCPPSHFLKVHLNIILSSMPGFFKWSHSLRFLHRNPVYISPLPIRATCPANLIHCSGRTKGSVQAPGTCIMFVTKKDFTRGVVSTSPKPPAGGPPLVGCPWLLIRYIRSYHPYRRSSSIRAMPRWQGPDYHMLPTHYVYVTCVNFVSKFWKLLRSVNISRFLVILYLK
jgi:hypothetical protein